MLSELRRATLRARHQTGHRISTRVRDGLFQVVEVTYGYAGSIVTPLSEWVELDDCLAILRAMAGEPDPRRGVVFDPDRGQWVPLEGGGDA